jgi:hypothetical protein
MSRNLSLSGPQLKPLSNLLATLDREGIIPEDIRMSIRNNDNVIVITSTHEYQITPMGRVTRERY